MRNHLEILRLRHDCGLTVRRITEVLGLSTAAVHKVFKATGQTGIKWPLPGGFDEDQLGLLLYGKSSQAASSFETDFDWVHREKQKKEVTLRLLWYELQQQGLGCSYSHSCELYLRWKKTRQLSMHQVQLWIPDELTPPCRASAMGQETGNDLHGGTATVPGGG
ncbi:MAG: hypothetical protein OXI60_06215 [Acidiferrobacterales bacterium]|nr:hypothetical protein [Acidiferrobacterales bacterium]